MKMRIPGFRNKETPHALSAQLRKSYIILCTIIIVFFLVYTIQVILFNDKTIALNNKLQGDHDELKYTRLLGLQLFIQDVYLKDYIYSNDLSYRENVLGTFSNVDDNLDNLKASINDKGESDTLVNEIESFIRKRENGINTLFAATGDVWEFKQVDDLVSSLTQLNDSIKIRLQKLEQIEDSNIIERTGTASKYNYYRIVSSIISYIIISILLIYALYKINQNIRRRLMAEERARINEKKYKTLIEDSGMKILVIDNKGYIKFANKNIELLSGHKPDEIIGMPAQKSILPRFRKNVKQVIRLLNNTGRYDNTIELQIITKRGEKKWILCKVFPVNIDSENGSGEWQVVIWDIDEEKKIQLELELLEEERMRQQKLIQDIIDNIPSIIFIKDITGKYVLVNKKMYEMLPDASTSMLGLTDKELIDEPIRYKAYKYTDDKVLNTGQVATLEDVMEVKGKKRYLLITKFPLFDEAGNVKNICGLATDITEQKESEIHLLNAKKEAENAKTAQEAFLANMSHEIRTPMNGIMGMANLLLGAKLSEEQKEYVESIQDSGKNLLSIINDLLDFSKIRSGKFQFDSSPFKLKHAIKKALYPLQIRAEEKLLKMEMNFDANVPDVVIGDPVRLQQIVINLAGNAVKFTSQGQVSVNVYCVKKTDKQAHIRIDVTDTGIGIATEKLDYIFESFTQDNLNTSRTYGGTGLGLAIVKQLVDLQDGEVLVESTPGRGSVFTVIIPFTIDANARVQENKFAALSNETDDLLSGINILVAEDNIINQKVVLNTLKRKGADVTLVVNGQEAIDSIKHEAFDIVLMDLQMPEVDGYKATKYIREVLNNNVPILAMTADAIKGEAEKCFEAGMTGFISKPFDPADLYLQILKSTGNSINNTHIQNKPNEQMEEPLIDFSFLYDISGNDSKYINDVIEIFLSSTPPGLETLKELVQAGTDWDAIGKQAHFLKSSVSVIKINGVYDLLASIEKTAFNDKDMNKVQEALASIVTTFEAAMPLLEAEKERTRQAPAN